MKQIKHLLTEHGEKINGSEYDFYPRPSLVRDSFFSLNGEWELIAEEQSYKINVPYPPESLLSGVNKVFRDGTPLIYKKSFNLPNGFAREKTILHFGAVDGACSVYLNNSFLGMHIGGYDNFSFDITDKLLSENEIRVEVVDTLKGFVYPYGKQSYKRGGMWYTPVSGIWQSVWLESVSNEYIKGIKIDTRNNTAKIRFDGISSGEVFLDGKCFPIINGASKITIEEPIYWSPENPHLYYFTAKCVGDEIKSYFALRDLEIKVIDGVSRLCLNGEPYFFNGVLDQGYFSDGIFTPASSEGYKNDIIKMKGCGFNTLRKHIKIEPDLFYYYCDKYGMIVFQDMINSGGYSFLIDTAFPTVFFKKGISHFASKKRQEAFIKTGERMLKLLHNHPCVCYYTIFNEGWGQFSTNYCYKHFIELDKTRIFDTASGWFKTGCTDVYSEHVYFKKVNLKCKGDKPLVLSEFGGYSFKIPEHSFNLKRTYGYRFYNDGKNFETALMKLYREEIKPNIAKGLCATVFTQVSDIEDETNGLLTYDRKLLKVDPKLMCDIKKELDEVFENQFKK